MTKRFNFFLAACAAVLALSSTASAQIVLNDVISVDFGSTATGDAVNNFNDFGIGGITSTVPGSATASNLVAVGDGVGTGVDLTLSWTEAGFGTGMINSTSTGPNESTDTTVLEDHFRDQDTTATTLPQLVLTFDNLDDSLLYTVSGGLARRSGNAANWDNSWTIGTDTRNHEADAGIAGVSDPFLDSYETYTNVASSGGQIVLTIDGINSSTRAGIAQLSIQATSTAVPEPSSLAVLGMGVIGLIARRRRA